jgi:hypothetical protein
MRTPLSVADLAVLTAVLDAPLEKLKLARRALAVAGGPTFDRAVALATVDRLAALGLLRKAEAQYEMTQPGRLAMADGLQDYREAIERMARLVAPPLGKEPILRGLDVLAAG